MRRFLSLLSTMFLSLSCFCAEPVIVSRFDQMIPVKVPAFAVPMLKQRHIGIGEIEKMQQPKDWLMSWGDFPRGCRFYVRGSRWGVQTEGDLCIYNTHGFFNQFAQTSVSRNHLLKLEAEVPGDSKKSASRLAIGVIRYGMVNQDSIFLKEFTIERGKSAVLEVPLHFDHGVPTFRVQLKISGDVILKQLTVKELPDDLAKADITLVEGTLKEISAIPDPKKSDYPDCRFTALLEGSNIIDGAPCPQKIQLVIDGFLKYKLLATSRLKPGDMIRCFVVPFEKLPDAQKSVQQADDLNLFELPSYYALEIAAVPAFSNISTIPFSGKQEYISVFERKINPPLSDEAKAAQRKAISDELARINAMLAPYSTDEELKKLNKYFDKAWKKEKAKDPRGFNRIPEAKSVWRNIDNSFWTLPEKHRFVTMHVPIDKDNLNALSALQDFLNTYGCQLIIGIVPYLSDISARVINREFRDIPDFKSAWLARELLNHNFEAVYVADKLLKDYNRYPFAYFYPFDSHPSDTAQDILTDIFSDLLKKRYHFPETLDAKRFSIDNFTHVHGSEVKYRFPPNCDIGINRAGKSYLCRRVLYDGKEVFPDPKSPILVLGNSFIETPMLSPDSFPTLLASKMCTGIASYRFNTYGPMTTAVNQFFFHPEKYLKGKRVMILILGTRHFYSARFNNIREMDRQMLLLSGRTQKGTIPVRGNENNIPLRFKSLVQARCFTIPAAGKQPVVDRSLPETYREATLVIPVCADAPCPAQLKVNGLTAVLPESSGGIYRWNRIVVPIPKDAKRLTVELEGKPGTTIALGDFQIFK